MANPFLDKNLAKIILGTYLSNFEITNLFGKKIESREIRVLISQMRVCKMWYEVIKVFFKENNPKKSLRSFEYISLGTHAFSRYYWDEDYNRFGVLLPKKINGKIYMRFIDGVVLKDMVARIEDPFKRPAGQIGRTVHRSSMVPLSVNGSRPSNFYICTAFDIPLEFEKSSPSDASIGKTLTILRCEASASSCFCLFAKEIAKIFKGMFIIRTNHMTNDTHYHDEFFPFYPSKSYEMVPNKDSGFCQPNLYINSSYLDCIVDKESIASDVFFTEYPCYYNSL